MIVLELAAEKMEKLLCAVISVCFLAASAQETNLNCTKGYWGEGCANYCGYCAGMESTGIYDRECDPVSGQCADGCLGGWSGLNCDIPFCKDGCNGGECVYPNTCANCGDISKVSPGCTNIKLRGLLGSLIAIIVLTLSLAICGVGTVLHERSKGSSAPL